MIEKSFQGIVWNVQRFSDGDKRASEVVEAVLHAAGLDDVTLVVVGV
jgi:hypothetical protein